MSRAIKKLNYISDAVYQEIPIRDNLIYKIINSFAFQRLQNIKQMGSVEKLYPCGVHTRFTHSLGVFYLSSYLINNNEYAKKMLPYEKTLLKLSCLLHDLGHGPYSHFFENITNINHEKYTKKIILENKELNDLLLQINKNLPRDLASVLDNKYKNKIIYSLFSNTIDLDRMDYLNRDSYFLNIGFGFVDYKFLLRNIVFDENNIFYNEESISAIENFLIQRYHMFRRVYTNPKVVGHDILLIQIIKRIKYLFKNGHKFNNYISEEYRDIFLDKEISTNSFIKLNDNNFFACLESFCKTTDKILKILVNAHIKHKYFQFIKYTKKNINTINEIKATYNGEEKEYLFIKKEISQSSWNKFIFIDNPVKIISKEKKTFIKIEEISQIINGIIQEFEKSNSNDIYLFYLLND